VSAHTLWSLTLYVNLACFCRALQQLPPQE